jgi:DNA-binding CsgD family transcriptional regulator
VTSPFAGLIEPPADVPCRGRTDAARAERARHAHQIKREGRHNTPSVANPWRLTGSEWACLVQLTTGVAHVDAAKAICISPKTLSTHVTRAKEKMGAVSVTHAILMVDRHLRAGAPPDVEVVVRLTGGKPTVEVREAAC